MDSLAGVQSMIASWLLPRWLGGMPREWRCILAYNDGTAMKQISSWAKNSRMNVVIDQVFDFASAPDAYRKLKTGRTRGRIVISSISETDAI